MESKGGCCIASRYTASGVYNMSKVDRIMLRFRPIAPKPANGGGGGGGSVSPRESGAEGYCKLGRGRRRQSKERDNHNTKRRKRVSSEEKMVTLPLISETPDCKDTISMVNKTKKTAAATTAPFWLSFGEAADGDKKLSFSFLDGGGDSVDRAVMSSCVMVECVTDTWVSCDGLGCTDEERKVNLGKDTCPGFISDLFGRVTWTNGAYKEMVGGAGETTVRLLTKQKLPPAMAFTCRVRVQYVRGKDMNSLTVPCDVWRMNGGGFAWRLDMKAALCLGR